MFAPTYFPPTYFAPTYWPPATAASVVTFRRALVAALKADAGVAAIAGAKIYPIRAPQTAKYPALLYQVQEQDRMHDLDGVAGITAADVQIGCGSPLLSEAETLAEAVRSLMDGITDVLADITQVETLSASERDLYDSPADASDVGTYWIVLTYRFRYHYVP